MRSKIRSCALILVLVVSSFQLLKGQAALLVLIFGDKVATENFYFSLKVGVTYSMITNVDEGKNRVSANFGLVNNIRLTDRLYLTPEFLPLSPRGVKDVPILTTGNPNLDDLLVNPSSTDRKLSYIDIPVLIRYHLTERWMISAGPQVSFLTGATDIYRSEPLEGVELMTELDIKEAIKPVDMGGVIEVSYLFSKPMGGKGMVIYVRYNLGFIDMLKENIGDPHRNSSFQFGAAFPFIEHAGDD
jgi:Outer membrane protein beta-barrel domain